MDCFIKKIFESKSDDLVHLQFQKFSRGEFKDKAMIKLKESSGKFSLDTTYEYARELVRIMAEKLGDKKTIVTGAIISALDLEGFKYEERKMAMGVRKYMINREMSGKEIMDLCDNQLKAFIGLSFKIGDEELKIKDKSPKSAKGVSSSKKDNDEVKIDFCKLKTSDRKIIDNFIFDNELKGVKKLEIRHEFIITDIVIPENLKKEKDFSILREKALRKGKIIRKLIFDNKKILKDKEFIA